MIRVVVVKINSVKVHFKRIINEKFYPSFHAFSVNKTKYIEISEMNDTVTVLANTVAEILFGM